MSSEIERKFLLGELPPWLAGRSGEPISQGYLNAGEGAEVRLRRVGERTLLTVKTGAGEIREEVEVEIGARLFDSLWPLTASRRLAKTRLREPLGEGLTAEVDLYGGELAGLLIAEVEFDSPERSREFAPPAWLGVEITGDGRYANRALATNGAPDPPADSPSAPSSAFRLKRGEEVADGLRRIVRTRAAKAAELLEDDRGDPAAAIHAARKDLKKIRATLRLLQAELGKELYKAEDKRYRDAGRALAGRRDAVVKARTLEGLERHFDSELPRAPAREWRRLLAHERDEATADEGDSKGVREAIGAIAAGQAAVDGWTLAPKRWRLVGPGLRRGYRDGRRAMAEVAADPEPELVHQWRKRAKDLWYQLRLIRRAWPAPLEATVERVHELTDLLGDHHDLTMLAEDLANRAEIEGRPLLQGLIDRRQRELLDAALELGARVYAEKPKAFERRLRAYWSAWR